MMLFSPVTLSYLLPALLMLLFLLVVFFSLRYCFFSLCIITSSFGSFRQLCMKRALKDASRILLRFGTFERNPIHRHRRERERLGKWIMRTENRSSGDCSTRKGRYDSEGQISIFRNQQCTNLKSNQGLSGVT